MLTRVCVEAAAEAFGVPVAAIDGPARRAGICRARFAAMRLARDLGDLSTPQIGREIGGRDHTSVLNALARAAALAEADPDFAVRLSAARSAARRRLGVGVDGTFYRHGSLGVAA